ncbi:MAG: sigma-70 family RNA polymerase sigma factor [Myxococcales bacterium]|nr:sigma-70 family RNA polymerase sigma factor [Myxococcales bacterium]
MNRDTAGFSYLPVEPTERQRFESTALPHLDALYRMAMRLCRDPSEAEDLVQDTMVRAFRFWSGFKPGTSIRAWLFTILRNTYINRYHRKNRRRDANHDLERQAASLETGLGPVACPPPLPDQVVARRVTRDRIEEALASLPPDYKLAVTLADIEGLSYREIADIMECPIGTVMSRIYRGRKRLHGLLHDHAVAAGFAAPDHEKDAPIPMARYRKRGSA